MKTINTQIEIKTEPGNYEASIQFGLLLSNPEVDPRIVNLLSLYLELTGMSKILGEASEKGDIIAAIVTQSEIGALISQIKAVVLDLTGNHMFLAKVVNKDPRDGHETIRYMYAVGEKQEEMSIEETMDELKEIKHKQKNKVDPSMN